MMDTLLHCKALEVGYHVPILPPIDLKFQRGEFWAVVGRNGSGKSTLFRTVLGLLPPMGGSFEHGDLRIGYVPQRNTYDELFPIPVQDVVGMSLMQGLSTTHIVPLRWTKAGRELIARVDEALAEVGALDLKHRLFRSLSEGQKQRVLLARLVASRVDIAFLDEPTAAMDPVAEKEALELLQEIRKKHGTTLVVVSHFLGLAREHADKVLFVDRVTRAVHAGTPREIFSHPAFLKCYGEALDHE